MDPKGQIQDSELKKFYYLSITILQNPYYNSQTPDVKMPFMGVGENAEWIYAISSDYSKMVECSLSIRELSPPKYLQYMRIKISNSPSPEVLKENLGEVQKYWWLASFLEPYVHKDRFYMHGIVNGGESCPLGKLSLDNLKYIL